ncbi:MAG: hypothetical protein ACOZNI_08225 [Myxococcota bacterium]
MSALLLWLVAGALAWLSLGDRMSVPAMTVVEWETRLGVPLWVPVAVLAGVATLPYLRRKRAVARPPVARDVERSREEAPAPAGADWLEDVFRRARALPVEPMGRMRCANGRVAFTLRLRAASPEQARRRLATLAGFLATVPTPRAARVELESCPDLGEVHRWLAAELARHFPADAFHVTSLADGAEVAFRSPDPRWDMA